MTRKSETMYDRLRQRLTLKEHANLLKDVLDWFDDGGAKKVKDEIGKRMKSIREE
jgi:hypothetical protein